VICENVNMKFLLTNLTPTDNEKIIVITCLLGLLETEIKFRVGVARSVHTLFIQFHPLSIVHQEEQPSPFRLFPSSHRSVITIPSPQ
jgi:hypothetical protein